MQFYILEGKTPIVVGEDEYIAWLQKSSRRVAEDYIGEIHVSTVFLVTNYNFMGEGDPILFETMVFGDPDEEYEFCERYCTWDEAVEGHRQAVKYIREKNPELVVKPVSRKGTSELAGALPHDKD